MPTPSVFDSIADAYDQWYEAPEGRLLFKEEVDCFRCLNINHTGRWLEISVGTGRFAEALGVTHGIDVSPPWRSKPGGEGCGYVLDEQIIKVGPN